MLKKLSALMPLLLLTSCSFMLYHPSQELFYPPGKLGLKPKDVILNVEKDVQIHGWYFASPKKKPKALIIFFHGNAEDITSHYTALAWILSEGYDFFIWDYRGYGLSTGSSTPQNTTEDGMKVILQMHKEHSHLPLVIFAQSLGAAVALRDVIDLHHEIPIAAVVVDSGFPSYIREAKFIVSKSWVTWLLQPLTYVLMSDKYAPDKKIDQISPTPLLVMHGNKDQVVDYRFGKEIFEQAKEPKEFITIEDGHHIDSFWRHDLIYRKKFLDYLSKQLSSASRVAK